MAASAPQPPLYDEMFVRLERARWRLADLPLDAVRAQDLDRHTLAFLRANCLMELSSLYAERMFLRDFRGWPDFCQFTSIWYYEEMKHYLVLRAYLEACGCPPDPADYPRLDLELDPGPWAPTLALHWVGELRLGMWYRRWAEQAPEPVLRQIFTLISADEFRHAGCYQQFMQRALAEEPGLLREFLQAAKFMLVNPAGDKHPTTLRTGAGGATAVTDLIPDYEAFRVQVQRTIAGGDEQRLQQRVLQTLGRLAGEPLASMLELAALCRRLETGGGSGAATGGRQLRR